MGRPFSSGDAERLITDHNRILSSLGSVSASVDSFKQDIKKSVDELVSHEVLKVLRDIPIEEINRDKRGFRIKALKDHGYNTIADIAAAQVYSLSSVRGISPDAAHSIRRIVSEFVAKARQGIKIHISSDNKNAASTQLISAISRYRKSLPIAEECKNLFDANQTKIRYSIGEISSLNGVFSWFFTSREKKQRAVDAYNYLYYSLFDTYGKKANELLAKFNKIKGTSNTEAWQDFAENSVSFFNVLEDICPGVLGNDDAMYGLPEEIFQAIQEECFFPEGLLCVLRRYQEWGVKYILHQERVLLGDEMGLGKTVQAIAAMVSLRNTGATHFVVVCPASVLTNWCREIRKMSRLSMTKVHGADRKAALRSWLKTGGVAVTTYDTTEYFTVPDGFTFSMLVVDEAHYIKNKETKRAANVREISGHAQRLLFMTGTALENNVNEMIYLIQLLQPKVAILASSMAFLSTAPQFRKAVAPVYYRRKREDVLTELPELIESKEWCIISEQEEKYYEYAVLQKNYPDSRRVSWNVGNLKFSSKAKRMMEIIKEAEGEGRKILVFSFFLDTIYKITSFFGDRCLNPITGSVTPQRRQEIIDEFDAAPAGTVLVSQIQSGGTGLNIQSASVVIICEPQLKPSIERQAISRAYRMGQTRNVLVYRLLCVNTVDEKIISILERKQAIFDAFADESVAANENMAIDDKTFGDIIKEEIDRINAKNGNSQDVVIPSAI